MEHAMASFSLQQISKHTYFIPSPTNMGLYIKDGRVILIDSGNDQEAGRQILKLLKERDWSLDLIVNTHSNADHIGGNAFLQQRTQCRIAATLLEAAFIQRPLLEPSFLFGGYPIPAMRNKFLMAKPSTVTDIIPSSGRILDTELAAVPLPGHYFEMIGIQTPDDVLFLADSVFSEKIIGKYHIVFLYDIQGQMETLARLRTLRAAQYLPSHGSPSTDIIPLIQTNEQKIHEILTRIQDFCKRSVTIEELLAEICQAYHLELDANQYVLLISTLKSHLSYLAEKQRVHAEFSDGKLLWTAAA